MVDSPKSLLEDLDRIIRSEQSELPFWHRRSNLIRLTIVLLSLIAFITTTFISVRNLQKNISQTQAVTTNNYQINSGYADISGAVNNPGIYKTSGDTRLFQLITMAGGLNIDADRDFIARNFNFAVPIIDQQKIYIPSYFDIQNELFMETKKIVSTELEQLQKTEEITTISTLKGISSLVSINTDNLTKIMTLPGVGEVTGQRIIAGRPYETIDDLVNKDVIKQTLFEKIKDMLMP
jgi:DNA uptake protein ComE-like DNA-binding protein